MYDIVEWYVENKLFLNVEKMKDLVVDCVVGNYHLLYFEGNLQGRVSEQGLLASWEIKTTRLIDSSNSTPTARGCEALKLNETLPRLLPRGLRDFE